MSALKFNLGNQYVLFSEGTDARLNIGSFRGRSYATVFQAKNKQLSFMVDKELRYHFCKTLEMIKKASPETRIPIIISKFNPQIKKRETLVTIVFGKNEKQIIYIEINSPTSHNFTFAFKASKNIAVGSTPMGDAESTQIAVDLFINYLRVQLPMSELLTSSDEDNRNGFKSKDNGPSSNRDWKNNSNRETPRDRTFEESPVPLSNSDDDEDIY